LTGVSVQGYYPYALIMPHKTVSFSRVRNHLSVFFVLVCLSTGAAQAGSGLDRAERHESRHEIDVLEQSWKDAILHHDVKAMEKLLADDYIAITANGGLQSKAQTLENLKTGVLHFTSIEFSDRKVRFYGQTALVTSRAEVSGKTGEGDIAGSYRYTRVYVRDAQGDWKIVSFEASRIRESGERK
jgi:ketosteroid isomerase-like protein